MEAPVEVVPILRVREASGVTFGLISVDLTADRLTLEVTSSSAADADDGSRAFGFHLAPWRIADADSGRDLRPASGHGGVASGRRRLRWSFHLESHPSQIIVRSIDGAVRETVAIEPLTPIADPAVYAVSDDMSPDVPITLMHIRLDPIPNAIDALRGEPVRVRHRTARPVAVERWASHDVVRFLATGGPVDMRPIWRFDRITDDGVQPGVPVGAGSSGHEAWTRVAFVRDRSFTPWPEPRRGR